MEKLVERFLTYVKVNTRSDANSQTTPTTVGQVVLAKMIETELHELGLADVHYNEQNGFLTARLPGNQPAAKSIGLIAHLDTADFSAENIRPQVITNYDGQDVLLNQEQGIVLSVAEFPNLKEYQGETLITTDGTTLLGADDKAGIVEILAAVEYFLAHPEVARG
ncbi:peptidase T, partial [Enterococcus faecalis]